MNVILPIRRSGYGDGKLGFQPLIAVSLYWWEDEFGSDLTDMIDCHVVFADDPPCLLEKRGLSEQMPASATSEEKCNNRVACERACAECKALWLMGEYD